MNLKMKVKALMKTRKLLILFILYFILPITAKAEEITTNVIVVIEEEIKESQVEGNVATVTTDQRIFGFNAHTGEWSEFK
jgi:hypothetical protein